MKDFTSWQRTCSHEAVRMSLEAVKEWLPTASKVRMGGLEEEAELTPELRTDLVEKANKALETLSTLDRNTFDIQDLYNAGHLDIVLNCTEFYGEYLHSMLSFIAHVYRESFIAKYGTTPEEMAELNQKSVEVPPQE